MATLSTVLRAVRAEDDLFIRQLYGALLPEYRNHGIETALIKDLMAEAAQTGRPLCLHVEFFNPALRLYERLGFAKIGEPDLACAHERSVSLGTHAPAANAIDGD